MKSNAKRIRTNRARELVVSEKQRANLAFRQAMGIAVIERPLRLIKARALRASTYRSAIAAALMGNGGRVRYLARFSLAA